MLFNLLLLMAWHSDAQSNSYTPAPGVIESSLFTTSQAGKESPFFITANLTKDSVAFIELVFTNQMSLADQMSELKSGLFNNAFRALDSNRLEYIYVPHLTHTGELAAEVNGGYFSRFGQNAKDSMAERLGIFLKRSTLFKNLNDLLIEHDVQIARIAIINAKILSPKGRASNQKENKELREIEAEIYFYLRRKN